MSARLTLTPVTLRQHVPIQMGALNVPAISDTVAMDFPVLVSVPT